LRFEAGGKTINNSKQLALLAQCDVPENNRTPHHFPVEGFMGFCFNRFTLFFWTKDHWNKQQQGESWSRSGSAVLNKT